MSRQIGGSFDVKLLPWQKGLPLELTARKRCKFCNRGWFKQNFSNKPEYAHCDYCNALHFSAFGWVVALDEGAFQCGEQQAATVLVELTKAIVILTQKSATAFLEGKEFRRMLQEGMARYAQRNIRFQDSLDMVKLGLADCFFFKVPQERALGEALARLTILARKEAESK